MSDGDQKIGEDLRATRQRLEGLAERAGKLREKLDAEASLLQSMERLAEQARSTPPPPQPAAENTRDDDGSYLASEGWEIALINEEGS